MVDRSEGRIWYRMVVLAGGARPDLYGAPASRRRGTNRTDHRFGECGVRIDRDLEGASWEPRFAAIEGGIGRPRFSIRTVGDGWHRREVASVRRGEGQDGQRCRVGGWQGRIGGPSVEAYRTRAGGFWVVTGRGSGDVQAEFWVVWVELWGGPLRVGRLRNGSGGGRVVGVHWEEG